MQRFIKDSVYKFKYSRLNARLHFNIVSKLHQFIEEIKNDNSRNIYSEILILSFSHYILLLAINFLHNKIKFKPGTFA